MYLHIVMAIEQGENHLHMERQKARFDSLRRPCRQRLYTEEEKESWQEGQCVRVTERDGEEKKLGLVHKKHQGGRTGRCRDSCEAIFKEKKKVNECMRLFLSHRAPAATSCPDGSEAESGSVGKWPHRD